MPRSFLVTLALLGLAVGAAICALATTCPGCDAAACALQNCPASDPYYCAGGPSAGGCGAAPSAWNNTKECSSCCDTAACAARLNCTANCTKAVCESPSRCAVGSPFMCTAGNASGGCAVNASYWPLQHECGGCCDVTTCVRACTPCTLAQCDATPCTVIDPYYCTSGPLANGCSQGPHYFPDSSQCFACCDSAACPSLPPKAMPLAGARA